MSHCIVCTDADTPQMVGCDGPHADSEVWGHFTCFNYDPATTDDDDPVFCGTCLATAEKYWVVFAHLSSKSSSRKASSRKQPASTSSSSSASYIKPSDPKRKRSKSEPGPRKRSKPSSLRKAPTHHSTSPGTQKAWTRAEEDLVAKYMKVLVDSGEHVGERERYEFIADALITEGHERYDASIKNKWTRSLRQMYGIEERRAPRGQGMRKWATSNRDGVIISEAREVPQCTMTFKEVCEKIYGRAGTGGGKGKGKGKSVGGYGAGKSVSGYGAGKSVSGYGAGKGKSVKKPAGLDGVVSDESAETEDDEFVQRRWDELVFDPWQEELWDADESDCADGH